MQENEILTLVCGIGLCTALGAMIGGSKNRGFFGALVGLLLGPIGVLIVAIVPAEK